MDKYGKPYETGFFQTRFTPSNIYNKWGHIMTLTKEQPETDTEKLKPRWIEVIRLHFSGLKNKDIADKTGFSSRHVLRILSYPIVQTELKKIAIKRSSSMESSMEEIFKRIDQKIDQEISQPLSILENIMDGNEEALGNRKITVKHMKDAAIDWLNMAKIGPAKKLTVVQEQTPLFSSKDLYSSMDKYGKPYETGFFQTRFTPSNIYNKWKHIMTLTKEQPETDTVELKLRWIKVIGLHFSGLKNKDIADKTGFSLRHVLRILSFPIVHELKKIAIKRSSSMESSMEEIFKRIGQKIDQEISQPLSILENIMDGNEEALGNRKITVKHMKDAAIDWLNMAKIGPAKKLTVVQEQTPLFSSKDIEKIKKMANEPKESKLDPDKEIKRQEK